jgi:hypothetical protein
MFIEVRGSEWSDLDAADAADGSRDVPMDNVMEIATAATPIALETGGRTIFELMERNENGKLRRPREAPAAPCDLMSCIEKTIQQQAHELMQLHRTVGHLANLLDPWAAHEQAQWQGMMTSIQEREQKWDARHENDKLWGAGITNMIAKTLQWVAQDQEGRNKERPMTARTDSGGLHQQNLI